MRAVVCALAITACSFPEKELIDAQGTPFGCLNAPAPTKADNPAVISGTVVVAGPGTPLQNASVAGQLAGTPTSIFLAHTDASGMFRQSQNTGGTPLDLYLAVSANGLFPTNYYPAYKVTHSISFPAVGAIQLFSQTDADRLAMAAGITLDPAKGHIILTVDDCNGKALAGGTVTTSPAGTIRYFAQQVPSQTATSTDTLGVVLVANLPVGNVMLSATVGGMNLRTHNINIVAGTFIQTEMQP
ncbi:MAG TPA: hypothetical protein VMZ53_34250 [Kofleriaceae bacterium]|nr:hypothetical protein [Kofleriaceae bacterium]